VWRWLARASRRAFVFPIRIYQRAVSPLLPRVCRYRPTCSEYTAQAIERFGVIRGGIKGAWRIMRCNPFGGSGDDPVEPPSDATREGT
jgi:putative membrane protein insertion efficiency factor